MTSREANSTSNAPHGRTTSTRPFQGYRWMDIDWLPALDLRQRLHYVAKYAKWESLIEIAVDARAPNAKCLLNPKIGFGGEHMIREVCFDDGVSWIAKLPIGPISIDESGTCSFDANAWGDQHARDMQIEIDTMNFLAPQSSIPVPCSRYFLSEPCSSSVYIDGCNSWKFSQGPRR